MNKYKVIGNDLAKVREEFSEAYEALPDADHCGAVYFWVSSEGRLYGDFENWEVQYYSVFKKAWVIASSFDSIEIPGWWQTGGKYHLKG